MPARFRRFAELLAQFRKRDMCRLGRTRGQARLQVTLRLSPELALHAQPAERQQQLGFPGAVLQPFLRPLEAIERILARAFTVEKRERAVPGAIQGVLDDTVRPRAVPEPHERTGGCRRYPGSESLC